MNQGGAITTSYECTSRSEIGSESDPADGAHSVAYEYGAEGNQRFRKDRYSGSVERTEIGGRAVDVFVITAVREGSDEDGFDTIDETIYFARSVGIDVRAETDYRFMPAGEAPLSGARSTS